MFSIFSNSSMKNFQSSHDMRKRDLGAKQLFFGGGFDLGFMACRDISIIRWGENKWEIPEKNHVTTRKHNLDCLTCDPS